MTTDNPYLPPPPPPGAVPPSQAPPAPPAQQPDRGQQPDHGQHSDHGQQPDHAERPGSEEAAPREPTSETIGWGNHTGWTPMTPAGSSGGRRGRGLLIAIVAVVLALLLIGGLAGYFLVRGEGGNEAASSQSDAPTEDGEPTEPAPDDGEAAVDCPPGDPEGPNRIRNGRVLGGGLSFAVPRGYRPATGNKLGFRWLTEVSGVERLTERYPQQDYGWVSMLVAGAVPSDAYAGPEQAAVSLASCMAESPTMYRSHVSDEQLSSEAVTIDGHDAWMVHHEVRIDDEVVKAEGDHVVVVVVDLGEGQEQYGVFTGFVPIGADALLERLERTVRTMRVP